MTEYKGIKRSDSIEVWLWLDDYCKNKDPYVLENDIVLQSKVKRYYFKKRFKIISFNIFIWLSLAYTTHLLTQG